LAALEELAAQQDALAEADAKGLPAPGKPGQGQPANSFQQTAK